MSILLPFLLLFPIFMLAVMVHEVSHGLVALRLGDPTALQAGRLTLNPLRHIDPVGTVALPLILIFMNSPFVFGWAKPVPINVLNLRHPKRDMLWVGAAGPAANFSLALVGAGLLAAAGGSLPEPVSGLARYLILVNLVLGTFNLLPIPPLDGSRVLTGLLPVGAARAVLAAERWGFLIVLALLYLGVLQWLVFPVVGFLARILGL
ncbi:MAG: site-2 protease family protein [Candidatus Omnitrophica bacterium]|nr:site-2 protease family protein [Candidatus Omnitrophota bacterium]